VQRSFGLWLIAVFAVSIFVPLAILSIALAQYFNRMFVEEADNAFENTLRLVSRHITTYAEDLSRLSMTPYFYQDVLNNFMDINSGLYFESSSTAVRVNRNLNATFSQQLAAARNDVVSVLFVPYDLDEDVGFLVRRYSGSLRVLRGIGARDSDWFKRAVELEGRVYFAHSEVPGYLSEPNYHYFQTNIENSNFSIIRLIKDTATLRPVGVIKIDALDTVIREIFESISVTDSSILALLDRDDNVILSNTGLEQTLLQAAINGDERVAGESDTYYISIAPIAGTPWRLCHFASEDDINQRTATIYYVTALFGVVFLIVALIIFYASSRRTVQSTNTLLKEMQKIASGDLDVKPDIRQRGYLSVIAEALTQTAQRLDSHIQSEYKAVLNQRNAEYLALQSQINPHFLNNILSSFITLNRRGDRDTLEQSIVNLSHLFRYVENNENLSTVRGEMVFLEEYLNLQRLRFSDKLEFDLYCTRQAENIILPKLLLQPLVENAIIHGMEPQGNNLMVKVRVYIEANNGGDSSGESADVYISTHDKTPGGMSILVIEIEDNGTGFNTNEIGPDSIGIANIVERLELFNNLSTFSITSEPGNGCRCRITMPVESAASVESDAPVEPDGSDLKPEKEDNVS